MAPRGASSVSALGRGAADKLVQFDELRLTNVSVCKTSFLRLVGMVTVISDEAVLHTQ